MVITTSTTIAWNDCWVDMTHFSNYEKESLILRMDTKGPVVIWTVWMLLKWDVNIFKEILPIRYNNNYFPACHTALIARKCV